MANKGDDKQTQGQGQNPAPAQGQGKTPEQMAEEMEANRNKDQEQAAKGAAKRKEAATVKRKPYVVAEGKSVTTKRGIVSDKDERGVGEDDFSGGEDTLGELVRRKIVKKR